MFKIIKTIIIFVIAVYICLITPVYLVKPFYLIINPIIALFSAYLFIKIWSNKNPKH